jgi:drug/metabolite transporter (DMT)-like permease
MPATLTENAPAARSRAVWIGPALLVLAALAWSGNHVIARATAGVIPPWSLNFVRWSAVTLIIGLWGQRALRRDWPLILTHVPVFVLLGATGGGIFGTMQFVGLQFTSIVNMGVMNSVAPALIVAVSFALFRDRVRLIQILGIVTSLIGVVVIVSRMDTQRLTSLTFNPGDLIIFGNMVLWAIYSACLRLRPPVSPTSFLFVLAAVAALVNLPTALVEWADGARLDFTDPLTLGAIAYTTVLTSITAYLCWSGGIEIMGAARASAFLHLIPMFGAALGYAVLGEPLQFYHVVGFTFILAGVTLAGRRPAPPKKTVRRRRTPGQTSPRSANLPRTESRS